MKLQNRSSCGLWQNSHSISMTGRTSSFRYNTCIWRTLRHRLIRRWLREQLKYGWRFANTYGGRRRNFLIAIWLFLLFCEWVGFRAPPFSDMASEAVRSLTKQGILLVWHLQNSRKWWQKLVGKFYRICYWLILGFITKEQWTALSDTISNGKWMRLNICSHGNAPSSVLKQEDQPSWSFRRDSLWLIVTNKVEGLNSGRPCEHY